MIRDFGRNRAVKHRDSKTLKNKMKYIYLEIPSKCSRLTSPVLTARIQYSIGNCEHTSLCTKLFYQQMHLLLKDKMLQFIFKMSFRALVDVRRVTHTPHSTQCTHYKLRLALPLHNNNFNNFNDVF